jgi:hypothetical protein
VSGVPATRRTELLIDATRFAPMMQASSPISNEHHYFPNVSDAAVHIHAYPPFQYPAERSGLVLTFWFDPLCGEDLAFVLSMDIRKTLWTSLKRYRLILAAWPAALVMAFIHEQHSGVLHNGRLAQSFAKSSWSNAMRHNGILCLAATAQAVAVATFPAALGRHPLVRDMLLGTHQAVFIMLIPVLYIVALSAAVLTASILQMALLILNALKSRLPTMRKRSADCTLGGRSNNMAAEPISQLICWPSLYYAASSSSSHPTNSLYWSSRSLASSVHPSASKTSPSCSYCCSYCPRRDRYWSSGLGIWVPAGGSPSLRTTMSSWHRVHLCGSSFKSRTKVQRSCLPVSGFGMSRHIHSA